MPPIALLAYYCALILAASIVGGMIPVWFQLTHRWMQFAVSFVAGVMLGVGVLHMLPHAILDIMAATAASPESVTATGAASLLAVNAAMISLLAGMLAMFFIERFFSYHHHDVADNANDTGHHSPDSNDQTTSGSQHSAADHDHHADHEHAHDLSWSGAALGLALHSVLNGVALAAAVQHGSDGSWLAGFGTFLVVFLHKPFDAMTIGMLMARGGWNLTWRQTVNALFSLAIPAGVMLFYFGLMPDTADTATSSRRWFIACALAFSAGTFLCISLSDLLPELQFHRHDRIKLSAALLLGLAVAYLAGRLESAAHASHVHPAPATAASGAAP
jgi:zinc and cadmium transporter